MDRRLLSVCLCLAVVFASISHAFGQAIPCIINSCGNLDCRYWATTPGDSYCLEPSEVACFARGVCDKNIGICFELKKENGQTKRQPIYSTTCEGFTACTALSSCQDCPTPIGTGFTGCTAGALQTCQRNATQCDACKGLCGSSPATRLAVAVLFQAAVGLLAVLALW